MTKFENASTVSLLDEIHKRDFSIKGKIYDAICILEKIKLIAYGYGEKYDLENEKIDKTSEMVFLERRREMGIEMWVLTDYIHELDKIINSINNVELKSDV